MRPGLGGVWLWDGGVPGVGPDTILILQRTKWKCDAVLRGEPGHPWGRFGAALTVLGDVNGDRLADVAIGAPGEQENRGAVYLFHGTSELGISPSHSQACSWGMFQSGNPTPTTSGPLPFCHHPTPDLPLQASPLRRPFKDHRDPGSILQASESKPSSSPMSQSRAPPRPLSWGGYSVSPETSVLPCRTAPETLASTGLPAHRPPRGCPPQGLHLPRRSLQRPGEVEGRPPSCFFP